MFVQIKMCVLKPFVESHFDKTNNTELGKRVLMPEVVKQVSIIIIIVVRK